MGGSPSSRLHQRGKCLGDAGRRGRKRRQQCDDMGATPLDTTYLLNLYHIYSLSLNSKILDRFTHLGGKHTCEIATVAKLS
jgi:hypothetical protein